MYIATLRSRSNDTDFIQAVLQVGSSAPQTISKSLGNVGTGAHDIDLAFAPQVVTSPDEPIIFNYTIVNAGGGNSEQLLTVLEGVGSAAAAAGIKALSAAVGTLVGGTIGGIILPIVGSALGALAGYLVDQGISALFADCDGLVAFEQQSLNGQVVWAGTQGTNPEVGTTQHPGLNSPGGCGANSYYDVNWSIARS